MRPVLTAIVLLLFLVAPLHRLVSMPSKSSTAQLVLQKDKDILKRWEEDSEGNFQRAEANWPQIVQKNVDKN
jgi:ABC-type siderophore export system fused ATPase/permease subunit